MRIAAPEGDEAVAGEQCGAPRLEKSEVTEGFFDGARPSPALDDA
jgi:hypothetical protein